jgi:hypothetical protein
MAALVVTGCGYLAPTAATPRPLAPGELRLPIVEWGAQLCSAVGFPRAGMLRGAPTDPRIAWLEVDGDERLELAWPPDVAARFGPGLEIVAGRGQVVARAGDTATRGCLTAEPDVWWVEFEAPDD